MEHPGAEGSLAFPYFSLAEKRKPEVIQDEYIQNEKTLLYSKVFQTKKFSSFCPTLN